MRVPLRHLLVAAVAAVVLAGTWALTMGLGQGGVSYHASASMSHGDRALPGILDPGEPFSTDPVGERDDVVTFLEGRAMDYERWGDHGDVILYATDIRRDEGGPLLTGGRGVNIVHRAIAWVRYNQTADAYDVPEAGVYGQRSFVLDGIGGRHPETGVYGHHPLSVVLDPALAGRHDGFLTKGDNNDLVDQDARGSLARDDGIGLVAMERVRGRVVKAADHTWVLAVQIAVPLGAAAIAGAYYLGRRASASAAKGEGRACPACGAGRSVEHGFCGRCGEELAP